MEKPIIPFEEFEKAVIQKILEKDTSTNNILREQYMSSQITEREFTGAGFFSLIKVSKDAPRVTKHIPGGYGGVAASINGKFEFGFVLFIDDGYMTCLEGCMWGDTWPEIINDYELYHDDERRV